MNLDRINKRLGSLDADTRAKALLLIALAADQGIGLRITQAFRKPQEQDALYAQGRKSVEEVNALRDALGWPQIGAVGNVIVTNAPAGSSWHNFRRAIDVVPMDGGVPDWNTPHWDQIGSMGETVGFEWGGRFSKPDKPHFQNPQGLTLAQAAADPGLA